MPTSNFLLISDLRIYNFMNLEQIYPQYEKTELALGAMVKTLRVKIRHFSFSIGPVTPGR
jgi:hypothetical protein